MESDVALWSTLAKLVVENKTTLFSAVVWAAIIGGGVSIWNSWRDRKSRERINKEALELQHQLKIEELIKNREIKEIEVKANKEIKQMELHNKVQISLLDDLTKKLEELNQIVYFFDDYDFVKKNTDNIDDNITNIAKIIKIIQYKIDSSNPHAENLECALKKVGNKASILSTLKDKKSNEASQEKIDFRIAGQEFNKAFREYLSYYYTK